jgi:hypothetical protein
MSLTITTSATSSDAVVSGTRLYLAKHIIQAKIDPMLREKILSDKNPAHFSATLHFDIDMPFLV